VPCGRDTGFSLACCCRTAPDLFSVFDRRLPHCISQGKFKKKKRKKVSNRSIFGHIILLKYHKSPASENKCCQASSEVGPRAEGLILSSSWQSISLPLLPVGLVVQHHKRIGATLQQSLNSGMDAPTKSYPQERKIELIISNFIKCTCCA